MLKSLLLIPFLILNLQSSCRQQAQAPQESGAVKTGSTGVPAKEESATATSSGKVPDTEQPAPAKKEAPVSSKKNNLPPGWPWRGVSVESKKTKPEDLVYLKSVNVNLVRIFIKANKRALREKGNPTQAFYKELNWADSLLDVAKANGLTCMIAFNNLILDPKSKVDDKHPDFWKSKSIMDSVMNMVEIIARRYRNRGEELAAYEVIGEPAIEIDGKMKSPENIEDFFRKALQSIRKYDNERFFLLTPGPWGKPTNYKDFNGYAIKDNKLIYGAHMYLPDAFSHQGIKKRPRGFKYPGNVEKAYWDKDMMKKKFQFLRDFENKTGHLIFVGEFQSVRWADGANIWLKDVLDNLEENHWSWAMYGFQCDTDFWDPYYEVVDRSGDSKDWQIAFSGKETEGWKLMLNYFKLNKK